MEVAMTFDILKRTAGLDVALVGVYGEQTLSDSSSDSLPLLKFAKGMQVQPDLKIQDVTSQPDLVVIPGGYIGVKNIRENPISKNLILNQINSGKKLAAICAGPLVILDLLTENSLDLKTASGQAKTSLELTSWPKFEADFKNLQVSLPNEAKVNSISWVGYDAGNLGVVVDENIITSQGPGTTMSFAVKILEELDIPVEEIEKVKAGILYGL